MALCRYYSLCIILALYLSNDLGFSDTGAGAAYGFFGMMISAISLGTGWVVDRLGPKRSIVLGSAVVTVGRVILATTESDRVAWVTLVTVLPLGEALGIPVLAQAVGVVSAPSEAKFNYGLFYTAMNVAVLFVGPVVDIVRASVWLRELTGLPPYRLLVWLSACVGLVSCGVASVFLDDVESTADPEGSKRTVTSRGTDKKGEQGRGDDSDPLWTPTFRRFLTIVIALVGVRCLFRHLDATFPKYVVRAFGEQAPYGLLYSINPIIIISLVPLLSRITSSGSGLPVASSSEGHCCATQAEAATTAIPLLAQLSRTPPLQVIYFGAFVSTCSVLWVVASTSLVTAALFVATLSVGEALWSPTFYAWTHAIAPPKQAGRYFALANVPLFLPKLVAGIMSGTLLERYCPGPPAKCESPQLLWLAIFLVTCPFVLLLGTQWRRISRAEGAPL